MFVTLYLNDAGEYIRWQAVMRAMRSKQPIVVKGSVYDVEGYEMIENTRYVKIMLTPSTSTDKRKLYVLKVDE